MNTAQRGELVIAVAEGLASTDFFGEECVIFPEKNRFYSLTAESRYQHVKRAEIIVDRIIESQVLDSCTDSSMNEKSV